MEGSDQMATIVLLSLPFSMGHIHPTLGVVKELIRHGEKVIYYATGSFQEKVERTGAIFRKYPRDVQDLCEMAHVEHMNNFALIAQGLRTCQAILPTLINELCKDRPALILHEILCPWGKIAAKELQVPAISYVTSLVVNEQTMPLSLKCRLVLDCIKGLSEVGEIRRVARELESTYHQNCSHVFEIIGNMQPVNLVFTSREFQPKGELLDERYRFVGPSVSQRREKIDFPWERLRGKTVIYISLGTVLNNDPDFFRICLDAFESPDYQVVIAVGDKVDLHALTAIPENVIIRPYVPQLEVLQYTDLFITHGGMNSVNEALYYHVPLIVIPKNADQPIIARRISELGVGVRIKRTRLTAQKLRDQAKAILSNPTFAENARKISETLRQAGGYQRAVKEIIDFQKQHNIQS